MTEETSLELFLVSDCSKRVSGYDGPFLRAFSGKVHVFSVEVSSCMLHNNIQVGQQQYYINSRNLSR